VVGDCWDRLNRLRGRCGFAGLFEPNVQASSMNQFTLIGCSVKNIHLVVRLAGATVMALSVMALFFKTILRKFIMARGDEALMAASERAGLAWSRVA
jgi:hypothetical protein